MFAFDVLGPEFRSEAEVRVTVNKLGLFKTELRPLL